MRNRKRCPVLMGIFIGTLVINASHVSAQTRAKGLSFGAESPGSSSIVGTGNNLAGPASSLTGGGGVLPGGGGLLESGLRGAGGSSTIPGFGSGSGGTCSSPGSCGGGLAGGLGGGLAGGMGGGFGGPGGKGPFANLNPQQLLAQVQFLTLLLGLFQGSNTQQSAASAVQNLRNSDSSTAGGSGARSPAPNRSPTSGSSSSPGRNSSQEAATNATGRGEVKPSTPSNSEMSGSQGSPNRGSNTVPPQTGTSPNEQEQEQDNQASDPAWTNSGGGASPDSSTNSQPIGSFFSKDFVKG
jgi:hypothetical protein